MQDDLQLDAPASIDAAIAGCASDMKLSADSLRLLLQ